MKHEECMDEVRWWDTRALEKGRKILQTLAWHQVTSPILTYILNGPCTLCIFLASARVWVGQTLIPANVKKKGWSRFLMMVLTCVYALFLFSYCHSPYHNTFFIAYALSWLCSFWKYHSGWPFPGYYSSCVSCCGICVWFTRIFHLKVAWLSSMQMASKSSETGDGCLPVARNDRWQQRMREDATNPLPHPPKYAFNKMDSLQQAQRTRDCNTVISNCRCFVCGKLRTAYCHIGSTGSICLWNFQIDMERNRQYLRTACDVTRNMLVLSLRCAVPPWSPDFCHGDIIP